MLASLVVRPHVPTLAGVTEAMPPCPGLPQSSARTGCSSLGRQLPYVNLDSKHPSLLLELPSKCSLLLSRSAWHCCPVALLSSGTAGQWHCWLVALLASGTARRIAATMRRSTIVVVALASIL